MRVAVTGASGFVGQALLTDPLFCRHNIRAVVRSQDKIAPFLARRVETLSVGDIGRNTDWTAALSGIDCVVHLAARAHVMNEIEVEAIEAYRAVNVDGSRRLAEQAAEMGVRRLVYLSSIKVNGELTVFGESFNISNNVFPNDPYGISKWEAELALHEVASRTGIELVIIRPPLVYGPGVRGNFYSALNWLSRGIPLPLGAIYNQRSLVGIDNLLDLVITCIDHPAAANKTFLVSDGEDISTTDLLRRLGKALHKPARLLPVPVSMLEISARLVGKQDIAQRLLGNLQVDISKTREELDWSPPVSVDDELQKTADWYLSQL